ncbi:Hypothetical protein LUCI_3510 [Lucifera butyrica]|uniref:Uncharacterized protein n=1 Tax=Lucifera butyrica TaxID=1351585 RepID=A0A498RA28_9FIRM|nr:Hypothetical protein LUCI_3510 [Lucifera butyrica]
MQVYALYALIGTGLITVGYLVYLFLMLPRNTRTK